MAAKHITVSLVVVALVIAALFIFMQPEEVQSPTTGEIKTNLSTMQLESSAFASSEAIPTKYTCDGDDVNPPLSISETPEGTVSLALVFDDPDAARVVGHTWDHWIVYNIAPETTSIGENNVPANAVEGKTSFGKPGYGGPCPPPDDPHTYFFKLYALDTNIEGEELDKKALEEKMEGHILESTELTGTYKRKQ